MNGGEALQPPFHLLPRCLANSDRQGRKWRKRRGQLERDMSETRKGKGRNEKKERRERDREVEEVVI